MKDNFVVYDNLDNEELISNGLGIITLYTDKNKINNIMNVRETNDKFGMRLLVYSINNIEIGQTCGNELNLYTAKKIEELLAPNRNVIGSRLVQYELILVRELERETEIISLLNAPSMNELTQAIESQFGRLNQDISEDYGNTPFP